MGRLSTLLFTILMDTRSNSSNPRRATIDISVTVILFRLSDGEPIAILLSNHPIPQTRPTFRIEEQTWEFSTQFARS